MEESENETDRAEKEGKEIAASRAAQEGPMPSEG